MKADEVRCRSWVRFRGFDWTLLIMLCAVLSMVTPAHAASPADGETIFALDLYHELAISEGNVFFSPYSISTALAMAYAGARAETAKQISAVLHFDPDQRRFHADFGRLQKEIQSDAGKSNRLQIANALWTAPRPPLLPEFISLVEGSYDAEVKQADFAQDPVGISKEINNWIAQKTEGKIENVLGPGALNDSTSSVLVDAVYFKGLWASPFDARKTVKWPFHLSAAKEVDAPLMTQEGEFHYMESSSFQAIEVPYSGGSMSMVVLLPYLFEGCAALEESLKPSMLSNTLRKMNSRKVVVLLPKYKIESISHLAPILASMGMSDAFISGKADFSGMARLKFPYLSLIDHNASVEVDEQGTEASAATIVGATFGAEQSPPIFRADHPFVFLIRNTRSGAILFMGRLADPRG